MLASNNGDPRQCAANLLKLTRGENPYDRIKGIDAAITDAPYLENRTQEYFQRHLLSS